MTDTSKIDRYAVSENRSGPGYSNGLIPAQDGGFVSYDDYSALRTELDEAKAEIERLREDAQLLDALADNFWDLRTFTMDNLDDAYIGWEVIEHHMAHPKERTLGRSYDETNPREAVRQALNGGAA